MALMHSQSLSKLIKAFKFLIFFGGIFVLYKKLADTWNNESLKGALELVFQINNLPYLFLILVMAYVNWSMEAVKWKILLKKTEPLSLKKAFKSVLAGSAVTFINPYRSGAFIGKVLFLKEEHRIEASTLSVLGGFAQSITTLLFGLTALTIVGYHTLVPDTFILLVSVGLMSVLLLSVLFFKLSFFKDILNRWGLTGKILLANGKMSIKDRFQVLGWSFLRYIVFTSQFAWILCLVSPETSFFMLFSLISIVYLILSVIPSFWFGNIGIRESTAVFILAGTVSNEAAIIISSLIIWMVNLVLPAISGSIFLIAQSEQ